MYTKRHILKASKILIQEGLVKYPTNLVEEKEVKTKLIGVLESMR